MKLKSGDAKNMIVDVKGQVTPECSRTHITYRFDIPRPVGELKIRFSYHPKRLEDLEKSKAIILESIEKYSNSRYPELDKAKWEAFMPLTNLITLSVDDPEKHRGAGLNHEPEQLVCISDLQASPGYVNGPIIAGMWSVTLSIFGIVTDHCNYELEIWTEEEQ